MFKWLPSKVLFSVRFFFGFSCGYYMQLKAPYRLLLLSLNWRYKLGFCPNGSDCRYRHAKLPGPPPPVEEVFQKLQQMSSSFGPSSRFFHGRNVGYTQQGEKSQLPSVSGAISHSTLSKSAGTHGASTQQSQPQLQPQPQPPQPPQQQHLQQQQQNHHPQQQVSQNQSQNIQNGSANQPVRTALPLPQGPSRCVWSF